MPRFPSLFETRARTFAVLAALSFAAVPAMQLAAYFTAKGRFSEISAVLLIALGAVFALLSARELDLRGRRSSQSKKLAAQRAQAIGRTARILIALSNCAFFALIAGTFGDDPEWRAIAEGNPAVEPVSISSIGPVAERSSKGGPRYNFDFEGTVPTPDGPYWIASSVSLEIDPRSRTDFEGLVWAVFDRDDIASGYVIAKSPGEAEAVVERPLHWIVGLGSYGIVLLATAAFSRSRQEVRELFDDTFRQGKASRRRKASPTARWKVVNLLLALSLTALYALCLSRAMPPFIREGEAWGSSTSATAFYGFGMFVLSHWLAVRTADLRRRIV
ncbi:hypothetical protein [Salininema proteolyticum]|uniref:Uncharacterized protein n=1 Tax=Salininema proteolyticum TaxID=1607685 RepID=A0ABV8TXS2_9ACTN